MTDLAIVRNGARYYLSDDPNVVAANIDVVRVAGLDLDALGISVAPEREDRDVTLPPTCAACGIPTDRVVRGTNGRLHACGYHGGIDPKDED